MPSRILPTLTRAEVELHNTEESCYVTLGNNVYDVTEFVEGHPGGPEFILKYAGQDVTAILKDEDSHTHSDSAYEILEECLAGFVVSEKIAPDGDVQRRIDDKQINDEVTAAVHPRTGMSCAEDLNRDTDINVDYKTHKFLDLNEALLPQVFLGGFNKEFYLDQVHRPRHYKGGKSAPLFGNFLEPISLTPWWIVPMIWVPLATYGLYVAYGGLAGWHEFIPYALFGVFCWTLVEYTLHRFLFHVD